MSLWFQNLNVFVQQAFKKKNVYNELNYVWNFSTVINSYFLFYILPMYTPLDVKDVFVQEDRTGLWPQPAVFFACSKTLWGPGHVRWSVENADKAPCMREFYLQMTRCGSLPRAPASFWAMSCERYFTPAPNDTTTKPCSAVSFTHASKSYRRTKHSKVMFELHFYKTRSFDSFSLKHS